MILDPYRGAGSSGDSFYSFVRWLMLAEGTAGGTSFPDSIGGNFTVDGGVILSADAPFGATSASFDGSIDWLDRLTSPWNVKTSLFTLDAWIKPASLAATQCVFGDDTDAGTIWNFYVLVSTTGALSFTSKAGTFGTGVGAVSAGSWQHIAVTGDGAGTGRIFVGGVFVASGAISTTYTTQTTTEARVGAQNVSIGGFERYWNGKIKGARCTVGANRYPGTATFTPPASVAEYAAP